MVSRGYTAALARIAAIRGDAEPTPALQSTLHANALLCRDLREARKKIKQAWQEYEAVRDVRNEAEVDVRHLLGTLIGVTQIGKAMRSDQERLEYAKGELRKMVKTLFEPPQEPND